MLKDAVYSFTGFGFHTSGEAVAGHAWKSTAVSTHETASPGSSLSSVRSGRCSCYHFSVQEDGLAGRFCRGIAVLTESKDLGSQLMGLVPGTHFLVHPLTRGLFSMSSS